MDIVQTEEKHHVAFRPDPKMHGSPLKMMQSHTYTKQLKKAKESDAEKKAVNKVNRFEPLVWMCMRACDPENETVINRSEHGEKVKRILDFSLGLMILSIHGTSLEESE